jgi:hypothetical protein
LINYLYTIENILRLVVLQLVVGWYYSNACPINQLIPHYLIIAGIVGLLLVILIFITQLMTRTFPKTIFDNVVDNTTSNRSITLIGCGICTIMCINLSFFVFLLGWSIAGWIWVIEAWHRVQYRQVGKDNYCHPILYQFAFTILLLTTTFKLILFYFIFKKTCHRCNNIPRKSTITSDDF